MAIYKRKLKKGYKWRAVVRIKGYPAVCKSYDRKEEALDWEKDTKDQIKNGRFKFNHHKNQHIFNELVESYLISGALEHHRSSKDTRRHLEYWRGRLGKMALIHLTSELIAKERQQLANAPSESGKVRSSATVNRYFSSLSALLTYGVKEVAWLSENPCLNLKKLKENPGRDRVLSPEEIARLLESCRESRSPYLYCIVLMALTTGARQGEILKLQWKDIDFDNRMIAIKETKNGSPRSVSMEEPVYEQLIKIFQARDKSKKFVFASKTAFGKVDIKRAWEGALKRAEIKDCRFHDLRHTFATNVANLGASNLELQAMTGHKTLQMLQRYTHLEGKMTRRFNKAVSDQITGGNKNEKD